jgi:serine/threonine-protein kinase RsbW
MMDSEIRLAIGSSLDNLELVQMVVQETLARLDLSTDATYEIGMAVREAVANAIQHGNQNRPEKRVFIDLGFNQGEVVIRVADEGEGFDLERVRNPLADENLLRPNGRGILFMREFVDEIDYTFNRDGGTVVTLRKRIGETLSEGNQEEEHR